jgi:hypothetical protein
MSTQNQESLSQYSSDGPLLRGRVLLTREKDEKISKNEESEMDFGEGERLGEGYGRKLTPSGDGARQSFIDEDEALNTNLDSQGHGEKPASKIKERRSYGGAFSPNEMKR